MDLRMAKNCSYKTNPNLIGQIMMETDLENDDMRMTIAINQLINFDSYSRRKLP